MAFQVGVCWGGKGCDIAGSEIIGPAGPDHRSETAGAHTTETIPPVPRPPGPKPAGRQPGAGDTAGAEIRAETLEADGTAQNLIDRRCSSPT
jgi:hypothetical protein